MTLTGAIFDASIFHIDDDRECSLSVKSTVLRRGGWQARRRKPRPIAAEENEGDAARAGRRRKKTKKRAEGTVAATRGGDLWWDYRWRYFFITVSPGRLSLFSSSSYSGRPLRPFGDVLSWLRLAPAGSHRKKLLRHCLYLPTSVTYTPPRARSARGGLYLNNIHELRYTRQIYCPGTRGFCEDLRTDPSPRVPPFLRSSHFASFVFLVFEITPPSPGDFPVLINERNLTATETVNRVWHDLKGCDSVQKKDAAGCGFFESLKLLYRMHIELIN